MEIQRYHFFSLSNVLRWQFKVPPHFFDKHLDKAFNRTFIEKILKKYPQINKSPWISYSENNIDKLINNDIKSNVINIQDAKNQFKDTSGRVHKHRYDSKIIPKHNNVFVGDDNIAVVSKLYSNSLKTNYYIFNDEMDKPTMIIYNAKIPRDFCYRDKSGKIKCAISSKSEIVFNKNYLCALKYHLENLQMKRAQHPLSKYRKYSNFINPRNIECLMIQLYEMCKDDINFAKYVKCQANRRYDDLRYVNSKLPPLGNLAFMIRMEQSCKWLIYNLSGINKHIGLLGSLMLPIFRKGTHEIDYKLLKKLALKVLYNHDGFDRNITSINVRDDLRYWGRHYRNKIDKQSDYINKFSVSNWRNVKRKKKCLEHYIKDKHIKLRRCTKYILKTISYW